MTLGKSDRWYFSAERLDDSPSREYGMSPSEEKELKQLAAELIQNMGEILGVSQVCINAALVFMHRFYACHPLPVFHPYGVVPAIMSVAGKVDEEPRDPEDIYHTILVLRGEGLLTVVDYDDMYAELIFREEFLLQTLAFEVAIDHSQAYIMKACNEFKVSQKLSKLAEFVATASLHLTSMCVKYKPSVVACFCMHFASLRLTEDIPQTDSGDCWYQKIDRTVTLDLLMEMSIEFMADVHAMRPYRILVDVSVLESSPSTSQVIGDDDSSSRPPLYLHTEPSDFGLLLMKFQSEITDGDASTSLSILSIETESSEEENELIDTLCPNPSSCSIN